MTKSVADFLRQGFDHPDELRDAVNDGRLTDWQARVLAGGDPRERGELRRAVRAAKVAQT